MNRVELASRIAEKLSLNRQQVEQVLEAMEDEIIAQLKAGNEVTLTGFGAFMAKQRSARMGVNPRNPSERIQMPAVTVAKFKAGKKLKDELKRGAP
ncbi:MAG: HU family DNA-binding protein [Candidatus Kerfeldbacteria bacterium]|nr:HU family DNA-binding protein [Candidatus Kerfeldbacteria bacterium]